MAECTNDLAMDLTVGCDDRVKGLEKTMLLINRKDIDWAATKIETSKCKMNSLVLKNGKTAFLLEHLKDAHISVNIKPEKNDDGFNGFKHSIVVTFYGLTAEDYAQITNLVNGAQLVAVIEHKVKGVSSFDVLGTAVGLEFTEGDGSTNGGVFKLTLGTPDGHNEPSVALKWMETDYATTKAKFDKKLVGA